METATTITIITTTIAEIITTIVVSGKLLLVILATRVPAFLGMATIRLVEPVTGPVIAGTTRAEIPVSATILTITTIAE